VTNQRKFAAVGRSTTFDAVTAMPSARYYREQARLLLGWALATTDPDYADLLSTRAMELLAKSNQAGRARTIDLIDAIAEFNDGQMRARPKQQQPPIDLSEDKDRRSA
jgi:hypothetical protein